MTFHWITPCWHWIWRDSANRTQQTQCGATGAACSTDCPPVCGQWTINSGNRYAICIYGSRMNSKTVKTKLPTPYTRGYPRKGPVLGWLDLTYPAHAGINRIPMVGSCLGMDLPRTRGDKPSTKHVKTDHHDLPRTRGDKPSTKHVKTNHHDLPRTCGDKPTRGRSKMGRTYLPRTRGDKPQAVMEAFSPL